MKRVFLASLKTKGTSYFSTDSYRTIRIEIRDSKREAKVLNRLYKKIDSFKARNEWLIELFDCKTKDLKKFRNIYD